MSTTEREVVRELPAVLDPRVERGAALLDVECPGWFDLIDLDDFSLESGVRCVRGQLGDVAVLSCDDYSEPRAWVPAWADHGFYVNDPVAHNRRGRTYKALEQDWRLAILSRRTA